MIAINPNILTPFAGLLGVIVGAVISQYFNHKLGSKTSRGDIIFKRKLEYFEGIAEKLESNIKMHKNSVNALKSAKSKKEISSLLLTMKNSRKNFAIMASPLYLNIRELSEKIICFVDTEKEIFGKFEEIKKQNKADKKEIEILEKKIEILRQCANQILAEMRHGLKNE